MEGLRIEVELEPETVGDTRLGSDLIVEVGSCSTIENSCEVTRSIPTIEVATPETLTLFVAGGNALTPVRGEDTRTEASSSVGPSEEIAIVIEV